MQQAKLLKWYMAQAIDIQTLCQPLQLLKIFHFNYLKRFHDGSEINLCNHAHWIEDYYKLELFSTSEFTKSLPTYQHGYQIWSTAFSQASVLLHGRALINSDHGITLIKEQCDGTSFYFFSTTPENPCIFDVYFNHIDTLHHFVDFFNDKAAKLIQKASQKRLLLTQYSVSNTVNNALTALPLTDFYQQTIVKNYYLQNGNSANVKLSAQELKCLQGLMKQLTSKEIAIELNINKRTVDFYIDNIKNKLACNSRHELVNKLLKNGFRR